MLFLCNDIIIAENVPIVSCSKTVKLLWCCILYALYYVLESSSIPLKLPVELMKKKRKF